MMPGEVKLSAESDTVAFGERLSLSLSLGDVIALSGDLGAGKTVLTRGIARGLGYAGEVSSPTFPIVQIYDEPSMRLPLWHVDLYRIASADEISELALEEARDHAALVIEWPERLGAALWPESLRLGMAISGEHARALTVSIPPAWEGRWPAR